MTVLPQKYGKWSMVIFQIMVEPFLQAKFQILSKHSFCYTSSFNPKGNQRVPQALPLLRIQSKPDSMKFILTQNLKNYHAPKNLRSDHAPSKNKYDRVPPKMEHGHFSNYGGTLFLAKFQIFFLNTASAILPPSTQRAIKECPWHFLCQGFNQNQTV